MYLEELSLTNFRTYENLKLKFSKGINVFVGNNAVGKTNILEAIYISSITKSYRTNKDNECISFNKDFFNNKYIYVDENNKKSEVNVFLNNDNKKIIKEDEIKVNRYSDFIGRIPLVIFSPEDMDIVKGAPKNRRKFLDILISQISRKYVICLQEYNKLLQLKNTTLKMDRDNIDYNYLDILDEKIAEKIEYICTFRSEYVDKVEKYSQIIEQKLSKNTEFIKLQYISEFLNQNKDEIKNNLKLSRDNDIVRKTSNKGISHDDILIFVNDKEVNKFGSQGQNRTALLSLKIAEFEILKDEKQIVPIILLDDVFSELDKERINFLMEYIKNYQVFITTTEVDSIINIKDKFIFKVENGIVEKK